MDYQKIASIAAPSLTPLAPAAVLMQGLHDGLVLSGMNTSMAWIPAASSGLGMELTGFLASKMTVRALKMGDGVSFFLAALGIVGYVAFAVIGIQRVPNADMFQAFVGMSTIAYFAYGVYEWMTTKDEKKNKAAADALKIEDAARRSEIEYNEQMAALEKGRAESAHRAKLDEIRLAKLGAGTSAGRQKSPVESTGRNYNFTPEKLKAVRDFLSANPGASESEVSAAVGLKRSATYLYMAEATK